MDQQKEIPTGTTAPASLAKPQRLICCCCGASTIGRQWHNRDEGYGLCKDCVDFCTTDCTPETARSHYGDKGIHYALPEAA